MQGKKRSKSYRAAQLILAGTFVFGALVGALVASLIVKADKPKAIPVYVQSPQKVVVLAEEPTEVLTYTPHPHDVELIGRTIWGEAGGVKSKAERAAVAWCILNRVDARGQTVEEVVTAPMQFLGYRPEGECPQEHLDLAADVLTRWNAEKEGTKDVGRTLPAEYLYFYGDGERNHFSIEWRSGLYWDWTLRSPYTM